jgi:PAS domain S-box-containing protein
VVDAPINPPQLIRRLNSLLVRRQQSRELMQQVSTLEEQKQRLRLFEQGVESTGNGIIMTDPTGTIEYVNPAFESIAGYTEDDVLGGSLQILLPGGAEEVFDDAFWRTMTDQTEWEDDIIIQGKDSHRLVVNTMVTALTDAENETQGFVIVLSDVTERIQREQDLEDHEEELDLLRQILTRYLRHNLRNDLTVIQGSGELLKEDESLSPEQIELAETISETSEDLIETSETARTYSSVLENDAELSPFDLSKITTNTVQTVRESFPNLDFEIDVPESCKILAREGIHQAVEELIDNAARHNDATDPWVRIQVRDRDGARLVIEDNGPGISDLERESLERGTETQISHSQGVGLWLSKWLIEGADGRLSIAPTDQGTRVTVDFPPPETVGSTGQEVTTLKERERRLQTITDRMTDAIIEVDAEWNVTVVDGPAEEMLDMNADTVVGRSLWDVFSDLRDTQFETVVRNAMESRSSQTVEEYVAEIDAWLEFNVYPEFDGGLSFYTRDITDRKERELNLQRIQKAVEATEHAIYITDTDGTIEYVNPAFEETTGFTQAEVVGETPHVLNSGEMPDGYFEEFWNTIRTGEVWEEEIVNRRKNGETYTAMQTVAPVIDDGDVYAFVAVQNDITERKEREETLERRTQAIDQAPIGITISDPNLEDNPLIYANDGFVDLTGYSREETIGRNCRFLQGEDTDSDRVARIRNAIEAKEPISIDLRNYRKDGTEFWNKLEIAPVRNDAGEVVNYIGFQQDVTERRERERRYNAVFNQTYQFTSLLEPDGTVIEANESALEFGGFDREDVVGNPFWEADWWQIDEATQQEVREAIDRVATGKFVRYDVEVQGRDETALIDFSIRPITDEQGTVTELIAEGRDITERKVLERRREEIIDRVTDAIVEVDSDWRFSLVNEQAEDLYGMNEEDLLGRNFWNVFEAAKGTKFEEEYRGVMESRESTSFVEYFSQLDGWFDIKAYPKEDGGLAFYFVEVTEQYERKRDLEQANEFLLILFETIPAGVTVLDTEGRITRANRFAQEKLGLAKSEITDRTYQDPKWDVYGKDGEPIPAEELPFAQVMETGETVVDYEHGIELPDGSKRWLSINAAPITGKNGGIEKVVAVIKDLTDRREYQEHLEAKTSDTNE